MMPEGGWTQTQALSARLVLPEARLDGHMWILDIQAGRRSLLGRGPR